MKKLTAIASTTYLRLLDIIVIGIPLLAALSCAATAWQHGYVVGWLRDGFVLGFYPHTEVHISSLTKFSCGKQSVGLFDLQRDALVNVQGDYRWDASVEATKVTIWAQRSECKSATAPVSAGEPERAEPSKSAR